MVTTRNVNPIPLATLHPIADDETQSVHSHLVNPILAEGLIPTDVPKPKIDTSQTFELSKNRLEFVRANESNVKDSDNDAIDPPDVRERRRVERNPAEMAQMTEEEQTQTVASHAEPPKTTD